MDQTLHILLTMDKKYEPQECEKYEECDYFWEMSEHTTPYYCIPEECPHLKLKNNCPNNASSKSNEKS